MFKFNENDFEKLGEFIASMDDLPDLYMFNSVSETKFANAIFSYGDTDDMPVAIIDATVFGSAKNGMAITLKGIYWKNDFEPSKFLSWDVLSKQSSDIGIGGFNSVSLPNDNRFDLSGSKMSKANFISLMRALISFHDNVTGAELLEDQDTYTDLVSEMLSILIASEDEVDPLKVELAAELINGDEFIANKQCALEGLVQFVTKYSEERKKSDAFLKLRLSTLNIKIKKVINDSFNESIRDSLTIILDVMLETSKDSGPKMKETATLIKRNLYEQD